MTLEKKETRCLVCEGEDLIPRLLDPRFQVVACRRCGLAWKVGQEDERPAESVKISFTPEMSPEEMEEISLFHQPPGVLLNVGRPNSDLLETARMYGFKPLCVPALWESTVKQEKKCSERILGRPRRRYKDNNPSYDVIRLDGALENDPDPRSLLQNAACLLGEKGLLVVSATDMSAWEFPLYGEGASLIPPDLPRWFFTPYTLEALLSQCSWKVLKISSYQVPQQPFSFAPSLDTASPPLTGTVQSDFGAFPTQIVNRFRLLARRHELRRPQTLIERARQTRGETVRTGMKI